MRSSRNQVFLASDALMVFWGGEGVTTVAEKKWKNNENVTIVVNSEMFFSSVLDAQAVNESGGSFSSLSIFKNKKTL